LGSLYNLTVVHFNPQKREFSPLLNIPRPPLFNIIDITEMRTIAPTNIYVLLNIGAGAGERREKKVSKK